MKRKLDIRVIYNRQKVIFPDSFIAIQTGEFVRFLYKQAEEIARLMGEPLSDKNPFPAVEIHKDGFEFFVQRLHYICDRPVVWLVREDHFIGEMGVRNVKILRAARK